MEKVVQFGVRGHLVGIVTILDKHPGNTLKPAILFLNAGLQHRVGPYRLHVDLCRALAAKGYLAFRFDLSGIGDSQFTPETLGYQERNINDIRSAMDFMEQRYNCTTFVLVGLCSGASNAHMTAVADERIIGLVLMDGFVFRTLGFYRRVIVKYLNDPKRFFKTLINIIASRFKRMLNVPGEQVRRPSMFANVAPSQEQLSYEFNALVQRGVAMLVVYTGTVRSYYNYAGQFIDMFPRVDFKDKLYLEYFYDADHTFTSIGERKKLTTAILRWINDLYG
jgi:pimeloyl-ACP methyl ester carboxylesterase